MDGRFAQSSGTRRAGGARRAAVGLALTALALFAGCSDTNSANGSNPPARAGQAAGGIATGEATAPGGVAGGAPAAEATDEPAAPEAPETEAPEVEEHETEAPEAEAPDVEDHDEAEHWSEPEPGEPCSLEEGLPDCIDPDGDGEGTYLLGGAECIAQWPDTPSYCEDLDGDGYAGYPDGEGYDDSGWDDDGEGDEHWDEAPRTGYGSPCSKEEGSPDCVDPDGDGEGTLLKYGEECIAMYADDALCADTDGDGVAGEADSEGYLPFPV